MISAFAVASRILKSDRYLDTAKQAAKFIKVSYLRAKATKVC